MKPSETPWTMLARRARLRPCKALDSRVSSSRMTVMTPSSTEKLTRSLNWRDSSPLEPLTVTWLPSTLTSTPDGMSTGIFPIRLMSPDLAHDLAAETTATCLSVGEKTLAGGHHGDTEAALDTGQL